MPRVIGLDAGTISLDLVGLDAGRVFLEESIATADALADPARLTRLIDAAAPLDLVVAPSGYGLPLTAARDLTEPDLSLAFLAAPGEPGGIGGLKALLRALAGLAIPVVVTPGVMHLPSVPAHRKLNRVDLGTADKVCAVVLALHEQTMRLRCAPEEVSFILLELGGAFTAAVAVDRGRIVDGLGGSSGPIGARAAGALDGEVAFLAGTVGKDLIFSGGAESAGDAGWEAYREGALKAIAALRVSAPLAHRVVATGRRAAAAGFPVDDRRAKAGAYGAALMADGLAGGAAAPVVERLGIREASGSVLDHLHVIDRATALARLGLDG